jgi:hypothetical protein
MTPITKACTVTGKEFVITDEDQALLAKLGMPLPTLCPEERQRRRMAFRNDHMLYHRKCDKTGKQIIALYDTDSKYTVYNQDLFWSDEWSGMDYGRDFDFSRPFFEQFAELQADVPRLAINGIGNENSDYTSYAGWCRNCYLMFTSDRNQDCYFGAYSFDNEDCMDILFTEESQLCYECTDCKKCYHCQYGYNLETCTDCVFCRDCIGCSDCFGCVGQRNKTYCFFNEQLSQEEYKARLAQWNLASYSVREEARKKVYEFQLGFPRRQLDVKGSENVVGDHIHFSQNIHHGYDVFDCQDCRYVSHFMGSKDCMDWDYYGDGSEMGYENCSTTDLKFSSFVTNSWGGNANLLYCDLMMNGNSECFGCIGLKGKKYCILNKQYTQEDYEALKARIIEHMKQTGEWGEFFPITLSPYAYNETVAQDYLPLSREEAEARGLRWKDPKGKASYEGPAVPLPDTAAEADDSICKQIYTCEVSDEHYKIIPQELAFYKKYGLPLPRRSPNQRYLDRMALRNPRFGWERECGKCGVKMWTSYSPERPEVVYCEPCYLSEVY